MAFSVALAVRVVTSYELAVANFLARRLMVAEKVVSVLLSATVAVAKLAITSAISASLSALFSWLNVPFPTAVFSRSS